MRRKLIRFEENQSNPYVLEPKRTEYSGIKHGWRKHFPTGPIVLELGAGRGEYTVGLAKQSLDTNFVGIDIKGERLWHGANLAREAAMTNVLFLRAYIDHIAELFPKRSVSEIWITFPAPFPKKKQAKKRLTHRNFLQKYAKILKPKGLIHLKTDSAELYASTLSELAADPLATITAQTTDLYQSTITGAPKAFQTHFEQRYLAQGKPIHYLAFHYRPRRFFAFLPW